MASLRRLMLVACFGFMVPLIRLGSAEEPQTATKEDGAGTNEEDKARAAAKSARLLQVRFFVKNAGQDRLELTLPRAILHGHYHSIRVVDADGREITTRRYEGETDIVGSTGGGLGVNGQWERSGPVVAFGDVAPDNSVDTAIKAKAGQVCRLQYTLPNYADTTAAHLQTGEYAFTVPEKGASDPKQPTAEELSKQIAWGKPGKNGLQVGVALVPWNEDGDQGQAGTNEQKADKARY